MAKLLGLGLGGGGAIERPGQGVERVILQRPLHRVLAFTGRSIHDVVNDPIARNEVLGYYKLMCQVQRTCQVVDLERWWSGKDSFKVSSLE